MRFKTIAIHAATSGVMSALMVLNAGAQVRGKATAHQSSATHVSAELVKGKLNPSKSKSGDQVILRLKNDVRANGRVILKKGTLIDGLVKVVKSVRGAEGEDKSASAQSMMEIEWSTPAAPALAAWELSIAVQAITHVSPIHRQREAEAAADEWQSVSGSALMSPRAPGGDGLLGIGIPTGRISGTANAALMNMPSIVAVDTQTISAIERTFGLPSSGALYKVGRGEVVSSGGARHSIDIFSHMSNDTVIMSQSQNFEVSSGAQVELLVGVRK